MGARGALAAAQSELEAAREEVVAAEIVQEPAAAGGETVRADVGGQVEEEVARVEHPEGEVFFRGSAEEISDAEAEEIARGQLARSGLLRGQRVRVAE
jgi:hypothetical protein